MSHRIFAGVVAAALAFAAPASAATPFEGGWTLDAASSGLRFQSVKNETKVETSSFATLQGAIDESGTATVTVFLDSVDTKVDLRNVRMRFLLFETYQFPEARVTVEIDPAMLDDLPQVRRKVIEVDYTLDLHGLQKELQTEIAVTLLSDDMVSVASHAPISIATSDFGMDLGVTKLEEAASVEIIPSASVSFDFIFRRSGPAQEEPQVAAATRGQPSGAVVTPVAAAASPAAQPASLALEAEGNFSPEACIGRFEVMSEANDIYFAVGSARLQAKSRPFLDSIVAIVERCPGMNLEVAGHTDSDGSAAKNQTLSENRAASVRRYFTDSGIAPERILTVGYGETRPAFPNNTKRNKWRNRRIEFTALQ
ncbi:OmpA family protein [Acuticoccus sp. MNP-M23]|uniref:OmpA family protein n=1 Tax=Acuticoccus sp. MNP-M23 TaxID=3072793 RepID=UPI002814F74C|nr:OmpA family protein [Acuticoccus sp. MNP-M23]WMS43719.1 OmpA family protein [Acuticoccus sp. MNP-M23]